MTVSWGGVGRQNFVERARGQFWHLEPSKPLKPGCVLTLPTPKSDYRGSKMPTPPYHLNPQGGGVGTPPTQLRRASHRSKLLKLTNHSFIALIGDSHRQGYHCYQAAAAAAAAVARLGHCSMAGERRVPVPRHPVKAVHGAVVHGGGEGWGSRDGQKSQKTKLRKNTIKIISYFF